MPIGRWPRNYRKDLEKWQDEKKIVDFRDLSVDNEVYFEIRGFKDTPSFRTLKLERRIGMSNMVALDERCKPIKYDTVGDILESFYYQRLPIYQERKNYMLAKYKADIEIMNHKMRFVRAVLDKVIRVMNRPKIEILEGMDRLQIPRNIYDKSKLRHFSEDDINKMRNKAAKMQEEHDILENTTIQQLWLSDLNDLEKAYKSVYKLNNPIKLQLGQPVKRNTKPFPNQNGIVTMIPDESPTTPPTGIKLKMVQDESPTTTPPAGIKLTIRNPAEAVTPPSDDTQRQPNLPVTLKIT